MQWDRLLNAGRLCRPDFPEAPGRPAYLQDYDRILFSEPFRRLAQKTQVHPLYEHDHVHHRMIHSLETASAGRSLGGMAGQAMLEQGYITEAQREAIAGTVQAACLVHDIGNPPFGHSGEDSIGQWFAQKFQAETGVAGAIPQAQQAEFSAFEGNAQGFRIAATLEMARRPGGMRLSYATLAAFMKYPCTAQARQLSQEGYVGLKKFGVFQAEAALFAEVAEATGLRADGAGPGTCWRRHPLAFLVEAADDICYRILDLEDAATVGDLTTQQVITCLEEIAGKPNRADDVAMTAGEIVAQRRAGAIHQAIKAAVDAFMANYDAIMAGDFNDGLMEASAKAAVFAQMKEISNARIFTARRKTELEISGRQVIFAVLDHFHGLYADLRASGWDVDLFLAQHGYWAKLVRAVDLDLRGITDEYTAMHSLADFVSGMTDRYAVKVRDMVTGRI
ncbi:dGTP triphosphohydrolase [Pseudophaeobacter flagellatus]|uniref:dGTP triphosphohydrolase n=1 Tax=Pseudophaeobacter flagellatus TaxID=2899119 RepID=UPI001E49F87C|nr:dNTP triphosphohydrolase [Pseudophaeobacter flagellatus]MCD9149425.1 dNTP triphosphohydrolase [Pseudophaeobacter flagellatus]